MTMSKCETRRNVTSKIVINGSGGPVQIICEQNIHISRFGNGNFLSWASQLKQI